MTTSKKNVAGLQGIKEATRVAILSNTETMNSLRAACAHLQHIDQVLDRGSDSREIIEDLYEMQSKLSLLTRCIDDNDVLHPEWYEPFQQLDKAYYAICAWFSSQAFSPKDCIFLCGEAGDFMAAFDAGAPLDDDGIAILDVAEYLQTVHDILTKLHDTVPPACFMAIAKALFSSREAARFIA